MKLFVSLSLSILLAALAGLNAPVAIADTYSTTVKRAPAEAMRETREELRTVETEPKQTTVIKEKPAVIKEKPVEEKEKVVVKKGDHHLIKAGPVKVF